MRTISIAIVGLLSLGFVGCKTGSFNSSSVAPVPGVFRYPIVTSPTSLDPGVVQDGDTLDAIQQIYEGLVTWSPQNEVVGALAESWEVKDDDKTYVFYLRKGVKFHSGRECTAHDVKWTIERNALHTVVSQTVDAYLSDIVGLSEVVARQRAKRASAKPELMNIPGIRVVDDYTLEIELIRPTPYFLGKLTYLVSAPVDKDYAPTSGEMRDVSQMVGTGPYRIANYERDQMITLEAFDDYHGGKPALNRIERRVIKDAMTRLSAYKKGEVDMVMLERQDIKGIMGTEYEDDLVYFERPAIWYVGMNQNMLRQFKDKRVRQAVAMAINKQRIVKEVLGGHNTVANGIVPPGVPGHRENAPAHPFDPVKARELLAAAGYPDGRGFPELTMNFREQRPDIQLAAEAVAADLKEHLNINVKLQTMEWRAYLEKYNNGQLTFYHMRWAADYLDPQNFLSHMLASYGPENKLGYANSDFDALCRQADSILDIDMRKPLYARAEDIVLDDAVWVPLYFQRDAELHRPWIKDIRKSLFGHLPHTTTRIEP